MKFSYAYLLSRGDVRLVYVVSGGTCERAFPRNVSDVVRAEWDADSLTLSYSDKNGEGGEFTLTEKEIEDAKETEAL